MDMFWMNLSYNGKQTHEGSGRPVLVYHQPNQTMAQTQPNHNASKQANPNKPQAFRIAGRANGNESNRAGSLLTKLRGGRVLLTEILLPRIARQETVCPISIGG